MTDVFALVAVIAAGWYVLGRVEAHLLRTGARHPAQQGQADQGPRLLPVWYLDPAPMPDEDFVAEVDRLGIREPLLDAAREADAGLGPIPDGFIEIPRRGAR